VGEEKTEGKGEKRAKLKEKEKAKKRTWSKRRGSSDGTASKKGGAKGIGPLQEGKGEVDKKAEGKRRVLIIESGENMGEGGKLPRQKRLKRGSDKRDKG